MKRLLALVLLLTLCLILVAPVMATPLTFQQSSDASYVYGRNTPGLCTTGATLFTSTTAGNQYMFMSDFCGIQNRNPSPFTYAAWTTTSGTGAQVMLADASNTTMYTFTFTPGAGGRIEVNIVGGIAYLYKNGILIGTSTPLATNPSYLQFWDSYGDASGQMFDDVVIGSLDSKYVIGMPTLNGYIIKKDMINPSASGIYNYSTSALVDSNNMYTTWARSNISYAGNESATLINVDTGTIYKTHYTDTASSGTFTWNVASSIIASGAPYGRYQVKFGNFYSTDIAYIADGAEISFDKDSYSQQDTAIITYNIDGAYWDTSTYTYSMKIYSGNDWSVVNTQSITATTGTFTYTFTEDNTQGEYYAVVIATPNAGGNAIWMNYDYAALNAYITFTGYVNDAETALPISGANVSITQNSIYSNSVTIADGNYTATGFLSGAQLTFNVTASGHQQYLMSLTPMVSKNIALNFTLNATTPTITGLGIGGVVRDGILTGTVITSGYGRPISSATCYLHNQSNGETYSATTNNAAWYKFDETGGIFLTTKRPYDLWCQKVGYSNSPNYTVVAQ